MTTGASPAGGAIAAFVDEDLWPAGAPDDEILVAVAVEIGHGEGSPRGEARQCRTAREGTEGLFRGVLPGVADRPQQTRAL